MRPRIGIALVVAASALASPALAQCESLKFEDSVYTACTADPKADIRVFLRDKSGAYYGSFSNLRKNLEQRDETLVFAMNGGMYHPDYRPVGLYVEDGREITKASTARGPGNFHLQPNGVFYVGRDGAGVMETRQYLRTRPAVSYATQSGPMLVINGAIHPKFSADSDSRKLRNGVGLCSGRVVFAISEGSVTFHEFARLFRDRFKCANALFLDGSISALYSAQLNRNDGWRPMGPIVGVVQKKR